MPRELIDKVEAFVKEPGSGYTSIADFVKAAIRERLDLAQGRAQFVTTMDMIEKMVRQHPELGERAPAGEAKTALLIDGESVRLVDLQRDGGRRALAEFRERAPRGALSEAMPDQTTASGPERSRVGAAKATGAARPKAHRRPERRRS